MDIDYRRSLTKLKIKVAPYIPYLCNKYMKNGTYYKQVQLIDENNFLAIFIECFKQLDHFRFFYEWIDLPIEWMDENPYIECANMPMFWFEYGKQGKVKEVIKKMIEDMEAMEIADAIPKEVQRHSLQSRYGW